MNKFTTIRLISLLSAIILFISCSETLPDSTDVIIENYDNAERIIRKEGNYSKALEQYLKFIHDAENNENLSIQLMRAYTSVSVIYGSFDDVENAIEYNQKAYSLAKRLNDTEFLELTLNNSAHFYKLKGDYKSAAMIADSLLKLDKSKSNSIMFHYWLIKGDLASKRGKKEDALYFFKKAEKEADSNNLSKYQRSAPLTYMAEFYENLNLPDSQLYYLDKSWSLVNSATDPAPKADIARMLMKFHTMNGNTAEALKFQDIYFNLTDSLINFQQFLSINASEHQRKFADKAKEIKTLTQTLTRRTIIITLIGMLLIVSLIFLTVILWQKRNLNTAYKALFEKNRRMIDDAYKPTEIVNGDVKNEHTESSEEELKTQQMLYDRIVKFMDTSDLYLNPEFGLSNIVSAVGSNFAYVSKVIKQYSGLNVPSFINEYRIREACRRILDGDRFGNLTLAAIGESVGFNSQVSFNRTFKKITGMTPSTYMKIAASTRNENSD